MAITREEQYLSSIANGSASSIEPITREEQYLAYIGGASSKYPQNPITRKEVLLDKIAKNGVSGGGGGSSGVNKLAQVIDRSVTEITAEDLAGVTKIGSNALKYCDKLKTVIIPDNVTAIGDSSFQSCYGLTSVKIGEGVTTIADMAFFGCALKEITIPRNVNKIGQSSLSIATIQKVTVLAETPPVIASNSFSNVPSDCPFYVKSGSVDAYKAATNWSARADYIFPIA